VVLTLAAACKTFDLKIWSCPGTKSPFVSAPQPRWHDPKLASVDRRDSRRHGRWAQTADSLSDSAGAGRRFPKGPYRLRVGRPSFRARAPVHRLWRRILWGIARVREPLSAQPYWRFGSILPRHKMQPCSALLLPQGSRAGGVANDGIEV